MGLDSIANQGIQSIWPWVALAYLGLLLVIGKQFWSLRESENRRPSVSIAPRYAGRLTWVEVKNEGKHTADFKVNVKLMGTDKGVLCFAGKWRRARDAATQALLSKDQCALDIIETHGNEQGGMEGANIFTAFTTESAKLPFCAKLICHVQVLAEPPLRRACSKTYELQLGKNGMWTAFSECTRHD